MPRPVPVPDDLTKPFWEAANQKRLVAQRCHACSRWQHPPQKTCPNCGSSDLGFQAVSGRGSIYTFSIVHDTRVQGLMPLQPFAVVAVELEESPDLVMLSNLPGTQPQDVKVGDPVRVEFEQVGPGQLIPQFRVAKR